MAAARKIKLDVVRYMASPKCPRILPQECEGFMNRQAWDVPIRILHQTGILQGIPYFDATWHAL